MNHWDKYSRAAMYLKTELCGELTDAEVLMLQAQLKGVSLKAWNNWIEEHFEDVEKYIGATSHQRKQNKKWIDKRLKLALAGYQLGQKGSYLLELLMRGPLHPGPDDRGMFANAVWCYKQLIDKKVDIWPYTITSPFEEK